MVGDGDSGDRRGWGPERRRTRGESSGAAFRLALSVRPWDRDLAAPSLSVRFVFRAVEIKGDLLPRIKSRCTKSTWHGARPVASAR